MGGSRSDGRLAGRRQAQAALCLLAAALAACGENAPDPTPQRVESRWPLSPETQRELEACVAEQLAAGRDAVDAELRDATSRCEVLLGIGSDGTTASESPAAAAAAQPMPIPPEWQQQICGLERGDGQPELERFLGPAPYRVDPAGDALLLQWEQGNRGITAEFDAEGLKRVEAISEYRLPEPAHRIKVPAHWRPNHTQLSEVEALLGEGLVLYVAWQRGLPIPVERARRDGTPADAPTPGCRVRIAWPRLDTGLGPSLSFRDGVLKGVF